MTNKPQSSLKPGKHSTPARALNLGWQTTGKGHNIALHLSGAQMPTQTLFCKQVSLTSFSIPLQRPQCEEKEEHTLKWDRTCASLLLRASALANGDQIFLWQGGERHGVERKSCLTPWAGFIYFNTNHTPSQDDSGKTWLHPHQIQPLNQRYWHMQSTLGWSQ